LITITRRLAMQLRMVFRRALGNIRSTGPAVRFTAGSEGLSVKVNSGDVAVEYRFPTAVSPAETLWLPFEFLADCEGKKDEPVRLDVSRRAKAASDRRMKTSHFEAKLWPMGLLAAMPRKEARGGESTQNDRRTIDTLASCATLVPAPHRGHAGD
jgi:hypothetical protein